MRDAAMLNNANHGQERKRWLSPQFSMRGLLVCMFLFASVCGAFTHHVQEGREKQRIVDHVRNIDGVLGDPDCYNAGYFGSLGGRVELPGPAWLRQVTGQDAYVRFDSVRLVGQGSDDDLLKISRLKTITDVELVSCPVTDAGILHLATLPKLEKLELLNTDVSIEGAAAFSRRVPICSVVLLREPRDPRYAVAYSFANGETLQTYPPAAESQ